MADGSLSKKHDLFVRIQQRAAEATRRLAEKQEQEAAKPQQMFLPGLEEFMRAMPNPVARSSLFAPVAKGRKKIHDGEIVLETPTFIIRFWGRQLDEAQADLWMQLMYEASKAPLGEPVIINRAALLRAIGRSTGKPMYEWLHRAVHDLSFGMISISAKGKYEIGTHPKSSLLHMIDSLEYDSDIDEYRLHVNGRWRLIYGNREFSLIDWNKRLQIGQGQDLAKSLQRLITTSADSTQRYALNWLKERAQHTSPMRKFKDALIAAMRELERLEIIANGRIERSANGKAQAVWRKL
ncbi:plasmid stabilization protein [Gigaspora margarita]|uniref:Plasmid stabilization protein n=1 Tax=Gigaspora margarita TaxID=4874 RepID=A0A8H3ZYJ0_GIGMA|nr:plasmid stabilization protein [Gigaspora margarita]